VIDVPVSVWEESVKEAEHWMRVKQKHEMRRDEATRTWYNYLSVALGVRMHLPAGAFGDVVHSGPDNPHLTRLKNVRLVMDKSVMSA
jgi:hypothetical protein